MTRILSLIVLLCGLTFAKSDSTRILTLSAKVDSLNHLLASNQASAKVDTETIFLKAKIQEVIGFNEKAFGRIDWAFGIITAVALALFGFSWWNAKTLHERDLKRLKEEVLEDIKDQIGKIKDAATNEIERSNDQRFIRIQNESFSYTNLKLISLWRACTIYNEVISSAREMFDQAVNGNTNYIAHSVDNMMAAMDEIKASNQKLTQDSKQKVLDVIQQLRSMGRNQESERLNSKLGTMPLA